ncbi:MAG: hypothetical protein OXC53_04930 [Rhodobacteraceae bacterium]|nr:hypothetical protein [Paracoccaceae bacterium]
MTTHTPTLGIALLLSTVLLVGCGGGGGGTTSNTPTTTKDCNGAQIPISQTCPPPAGGGNGGGNGGGGTGDGTGGGTDSGTSPGGGTGTSTGTSTNPGSTNTGGRTPDGILWDDPDDDSDDLVPYKFQTAYTIPMLKDDDPATPDVDETMRRETYIMKYILRDADYAERSAQTISNDIFDIRAGIEADDTGVRKDRFTDAGEDTLPLIAFGTARDPANPHPLVAKRGVSADIDTEAKKDIMKIRDEEITRLDQYLARAEAAKQALEDEIKRLTAEADKRYDDSDGDGDGIGDGVAQMKQAEADDLNVEILMLEQDKANLDGEAQNLDSEAVRFMNDPQQTRPDICGDEADCRAKAAEKRLEIAAIDEDITDKTQMVTDLTQEAEEARAKAANYRGEIPGLEAHVATVEVDIADINLLKTPIITTLEAEEEAADPSRLARLVQDTITGIALEGGYPRNTDGDSDVDSVDIAALRGVRGRFAAARNPDELARPGPEAAEDLDMAGDAVVFARAPLAKMEDLPTDVMTPVAALRAIVRAAQPTVDVAQIVVNLRLEASSGDPQALQALDTGLGRHWRMNLDNHALTEMTDFDDAKKMQLGANQGQSAPAIFNGVYGTVYCATTACNDLSDSITTTFGAGWYFTPSLPATTENPNARDNPRLPSTQPTRFRYTANADGTFAPLWYADYGMWLTWDVSPGTGLGIETRAGLVGPKNGGIGRALDLTTPMTSSNNLAARATYNGTAHGLSARTTTSGGESTTASGHFMADVTLNARFGGTPTLGGTIDNFQSADPANQGSDHVNPAWSLTLREAVLSNSGVIRAQSGEYVWDHDDDESTPDQACGTRLNCGDPRTGVFTDDDVTGRWSAQGYIASGVVPPEGARPTGFYGGFVAAFDDDGIDQGTAQYPNGDGNLYDDGAAIGVYSADIPPQ